MVEYVLKHPQLATVTFFWLSTPDKHGFCEQFGFVHRSITDPHFVMIDLDLEFDIAPEAERLLEQLRRLWVGPGGAVTRNPEGWIVETIESKSL